MLLLPKKIGPFTLTRKLGADGVTDTYAGILDEPAGKQVVVRRIAPALLENGATVREIEARVRDLTVLRHPALVPIIDFVQHDGERYLVEDWTDGVDLQQVLAWCRDNDRTLPANVYLHLATRICNGLEALHGRPGSATGADNLLHLALTPAAVRLTPDGDVRIGGYGLVRSPSAVPAVAQGGPQPTMTCLSPEQTQPDQALGPASDIFALGSLLYEMVMLAPLFAAESGLQTLHRIRRAEVTAQLLEVKERLPGLDKVLYRSLSLNPRHRYQRAFVLREDLRGLMAGYSFASIEQEVRSFLAPLLPGADAPAPPVGGAVASAGTDAPGLQAGQHGDETGWVRVDRAAPNADAEQPAEARSGGATLAPPDESLPPQPAPPPAPASEPPPAVEPEAPAPAPQAAAAPADPEPAVPAPAAPEAAAPETAAPEASASSSLDDDDLDLYPPRRSRTVGIVAAAGVGVLLLGLFCAGGGALLFGLSTGGTPEVTEAPPTEPPPEATADAQGSGEPDADPSAEPAGSDASTASAGSATRPSAAPTRSASRPSAAPTRSASRPSAAPTRSASRPAASEPSRASRPAPEPSRAAVSGWSSSDDAVAAVDPIEAARPSELGTADEPVALEPGSLSDYSELALRGALSEADRDHLAAFGTDDPDYTRAHVVLYQDAKARGDHRARAQIMRAIMELPENRYNPQLLVEEAELNVRRKDYDRALELASDAERHWARLPSDLIFSRKAMIYEIQATSWQGRFYESGGEDLDALYNAIRSWERYRGHVGGKPGMASRAEAELSKLYDMQRRLE